MPNNEKIGPEDHPRGHEEIDLDDAVEAALDAAWERLSRDPEFLKIRGQCIDDEAESGPNNVGQVAASD